MEIYIEDAIFVNILTSLIICSLTLKCLKIKKNNFRFILTIVLSVAVSIFSAFITLNNIMYLIIKLAIGIILSSILTKPRKIKQMLTAFLMFMLNTFLMGGVCYAILGFANQNFQLNSAISSNLMVGFVLLSAIVYYLILNKLLKVFYARKQINQYCFSVNLTINNITKNIVGFLDSGNNITHNGLPISIIPLNLAIQFNKSINIVSLLQKNKVLLPESAYIKYSTVSGHGSMLVFKPSKFEIKIGNSFLDFSNSYIGISLKEISSSNSYSILLNSYLI